MAIIAVDMDEVMADALGEYLKRYNAMFQSCLDREHLHGRRLQDVVPLEHIEAAGEIVQAGDFYANLEVMPGAQAVLKKLSKNHEIFITTAAMEVPASFHAKYKWLERHFPFLSPMNYVFCGAKHIVAADFLIDDNAHHFRRFQGEGILFDAPHNQRITGYRRVKNWKEVEAIFAGMPVTA